MLAEWEYIDLLKRQKGLSVRKPMQPDGRRRTASGARNKNAAHLIATIKHGANSETRVYLSRYRSGVGVYVRRWYRREVGEMRPSRHGIWVPMDQAETVIAAMKLACSRFEMESARTAGGGIPSDEPHDDFEARP